MESRSDGTPANHKNNLNPPVSGLTPYAVAGCRPLLSSGLRYLLFVSRGLGLRVSLRSLATPSQVARYRGLTPAFPLRSLRDSKFRGHVDRKLLDKLAFFATD